MRLLDASDYQPVANALYNILADKIRRMLPDAVIEHIGSSAIPGAVSKGDLDVFVGVQPYRFAMAAQAIRGFGFRLKHDTLQTDQLHYFTSESYPIDVGIQLVELGSKFEFFREFRDLLRANENLRDHYNQVKRKAAALNDDDYRNRKAEFIEAALRGERQFLAALARP